MPFKKGDKVRLIENSDGLSKGELFIIDEEGSSVPWCIRVKDGERHVINLEHLELATPSWEYLSVGDIILDEDGDEIKVLEVLTSSFLISGYGDFDKAEKWYTKTEAQKNGWTLKGTDDVQEMTVAEISKALGKTVKVVE